MLYRFLSLALALAFLAPAASAQHARAADLKGGKIAMPSNTIVDIAAGNGNFETLVAAVTEAGLVETLMGPGPFTVFAPTDDAFAALGDNVVQDLLRPANRDRLIAILTYHVVPGRLDSFDLANRNELDTVNGQSLSVGLGVDDARYVLTDVRASNGIVHAIDRVLIPRDLPPTRRGH